MIITQISNNIGGNEQICFHRLSVFVQCPGPIDIFELEGFEETDKKKSVKI